MKVTLIAAVAKNGVIGSRSGGIPWNLPRDTQHFRAYMQGKWMLLGRKTFEEMEGWFTDQTPVVLTRSDDFVPSLGHRVSGAGEAIELAKANQVDELVVSGGSAIYHAVMSLANRLVITHIEAEFDGDLTFPGIDETEWIVEGEEHWEPDELNEFPMRLRVYRRRG